MKIERPNKLVNRQPPCIRYSISNIVFQMQNIEHIEYSVSDP